MALPVILDVDTGVDDAWALILAARSPRLDLRAVTCVSGNVGVDQVVANTAYVLDVAGAPEVPVGRGATRPLLTPPHHAPEIHGTDGLGGGATMVAMSSSNEFFWTMSGMDAGGGGGRGAGSGRRAGSG